MTILQPLRGADLCAASAVTVPWIWEGLLAEGSVTLLTGQWKAGKSTLLSVLLAKRCRGGLLLDRAVEPGASAIVTEESADTWRRRARQFDFGPDLSLYCRPFSGLPAWAQWHALIDRLAEEHAKHQVHFVAFDPLSNFLPSGENNAARMLEALQPLRRLTDRGVAVLLLHHPSKEDHGVGRASRGSGALPAFADIVLEMRLPGGDPASYRRRILGFSRFQETPRQLLAELNLPGTDYTLLDDRDISDDFSANWDLIHALIAAATSPPTRQEILQRWPAQSAAPHEATLWRWLHRAVGLGLVEMEGKGTRYEPFRFRVAEQ